MGRTTWFATAIACAACAQAASLVLVDEPTRIALGQTARLEFGTVPQRDTTVTLQITARMDFRALSGSNMFMAIELNARPVTAAKSRSVPRLLNKPLVSPVAPHLPATWFDGGKWRLLYSPDFQAARKRTYYVGDPYTYVLDVTDLTNPAAENRLAITNTSYRHNAVFKDGGGDLVIGRLTVHTAPGASATMLPDADVKPVVNTGQPAAGPAPYTGEVLPGGGFALTAGQQRWEFATTLSYPNAGLNRMARTAEAQPGWRVTVAGREVTGVGPHYRVRRVLRFGPRRVSVADTITNASADSALGLLVQHELDLAGRSGVQVRIAGNPDPAISNYHAPGNPSVHVAEGHVGVGLLCEDTVLRNQARLYYEPAPPRAGIRTEMLWLPPGGARTLEWSVYPVASRDYYDFINLVREDWGSNFTVQGAWTFFNPDTIIATPADKLGPLLDRQGINYACYCGGWVDRKHDPKKIGFGTGVMDPYWTDFRRRLKLAAKRLREAKPGIKVLIYYDTQRDTSDGGHERFRDSWLADPMGRQYRTNWSGRYSLTYSMVAALDRSFGKAMLNVADRYIDDVGADGLYWDEMEVTGYGAPLLTHNILDDCSCLLDPKTYTIARRVGITALLGEAHRLEVIRRVRAKGGTLMGNGPPLTRKMLQAKVQRMAEIQHNDYWCYQGHLDTPLGYASWRPEFSNWLRALRMATLLVGTRYTYEHEISRYVFPFTPIELHYGYLLGQERIITLHTGAYGWPGDGSLVVCHHFDTKGIRHPADWPTTYLDAAARTSVTLGDGEAAVLQRLPYQLVGQGAATVRRAKVEAGVLTLHVAAKGEVVLRGAGVEQPLPVSAQPSAVTIKLPAGPKAD